jgi:hypothetical protein
MPNGSVKFRTGSACARSPLGRSSTQTTSNDFFVLATFLPLLRLATFRLETTLRRLKHGICSRAVGRCVKRQSRLHSFSVYETEPDPLPSHFASNPYDQLFGTIRVQIKSVQQLNMNSVLVDILLLCIVDTHQSFDLFHYSLRISDQIAINVRC